MVILAWPADYEGDLADDWPKLVKSPPQPAGHCYTSYMWFYEVAPTKIVRSGVATFTYHADTQLSSGQLVTIPVGKQMLNGIVIENVPKPQYETKAIASIIDPLPLPRPIVELALWMTEYYRTPLATVLQTVLPRGLTTKRRQRDTSIHTSVRSRTKIVFNEDRQPLLSKLWIPRRVLSSFKG